MIGISQKDFYSFFLALPTIFSHRFYVQFSPFSSSSLQVHSLKILKSCMTAAVQLLCGLHFSHEQVHLTRILDALGFPKSVKITNLRTSKNAKNAKIKGKREKIVQNRNILKKRDNRKSESLKSKNFENLTILKIQEKTKITRKRVKLEKNAEQERQQDFKNVEAREA